MPGGSISSSTTEPGIPGDAVARDGEPDDILVEGEPAFPPTHPGELLGGTVLPALGLSVTAAARELGVTRQTLHRLIAGKVAVTPEMALRLGRWAGNGPGLWLRMQEAFDLWQAERRLGGARQDPQPCSGDRIRLALADANRRQVPCSRIPSSSRWFISMAGSS
jgi:addiction module HigA family antidote